MKIKILALLLLAFASSSPAASIFYDGLLIDRTPDEASEILNGVRISGIIELDLASTVANTPRDLADLGDGRFFSLFDNSITNSFSQIGDDTIFESTPSSLQFVTLRTVGVNNVNTASIRSIQSTFLGGTLSAITQIDAVLNFEAADNSLFNTLETVSDLQQFQQALASGQLSFSDASIRIRAENSSGQPFTVGRYDLEFPFISIEGIPEPSTTMTLALALLGGLARRKR